MRKVLYILILMFVLAGCKTRYIEVPKVHTEYITKNLVSHDTIITKDSVLIRDKGDTVFVDRIRYKDKISIVHKTDTVNKVDSITVVRQVEKRLSFTQKSYMALGKVFGLLILAGLIWLVLKIFRR